MRRIALAVCWMTLFGSIGSAAITPSDPVGAPLQNYIVTLVDHLEEAPGSVGRDIASTHSGSLGAVFKHALKGFVVSLPADEVDSVASDLRVATIEEDVVVTIFDMPTGVDRVEADRVPVAAIDGIDVELDVDIAVLDTGIDFDHPDLNVVNRVDCTVSILRARCKKNAGDDIHGHGTHVAGSAAARDNGIGVTGVAPGSRLWAVKALGDDGTGFGSWIVAAIDYVTAHADEIDVANMSFGFEGTLEAVDKAIANSVAAGVVYTAAAGNSSKDATTFSPANHPDVITVSAAADFDGLGGGAGTSTCRDDMDDSLADFSNFGAVVEIAAPGVCIESTWPGGGYKIASGTSMASPHVAGAVGLYILHNGRDLTGNGTVDGDDVLAISTGVVTSGIPQNDACGFTDDSADGFAEPLLFVNATAFGGDGSCGLTLVRWLSPAVQAVVTGSVLLHVSVVEDTAGSSGVEWAVDGGTWQSMTFDMNSGSYGATWDTSGVAMGRHTLTARMTDSFGEVQDTQREVVVARELQGWWELDDGSGLTAVDSSGNGQDGSLVNGAVWGSGRLGGGLILDGVDDFLDLPSVVMDGLDDVTVTGWVMTTETGQQAVVSAANGGNSNEFLLFLASDTEVWFFPGEGDGSSDFVSWTVSSLADGAWHHLALVRDGFNDQATLYVDGVSQGTITTTINSLTVSPGGLVVGQEQDSVGGGFSSSQALAGTVDDLRIYSRVLSSSEIFDLANP